MEKDNTQNLIDTLWAEWLKETGCEHRTRMERQLMEFAVSRTIERSADAERLRIATAAMQGLLAGGWLAEHNDIAAEALRQADALITRSKEKEENHE